MAVNYDTQSPSVRVRVRFRIRAMTRIRLCLKHEQQCFIGI